MESSLTVLQKLSLEVPYVWACAQSCPTLVTTWSVAHGSGLLFPPPEYLPDPREDEP